MNQRQFFLPQLYWQLLLSCQEAEIDCPRNNLSEFPILQACFCLSACFLPWATARARF